MKIKILINLFLLLILTSLASGCARTSLIQNVSNAPVTTVATGKKYTLTDVRDAIVRAGTSLGWQMQDVVPGHIVGTLYLRTHMAQVDIKYSTTAYSITYKDSSNLKYDGTKIHSNYNGWIQNLDKAIKIQLSTM